MIVIIMTMIMIIIGPLGGPDADARGRPAQRLDAGCPGGRL